MPKTKELTKEEKSIADRQRMLEYVLEKVPHVNEPTYRFSVGDEVRYGSFLKAIVKEVLYDGKIYVLDCTADGKRVERVPMWTEVRPITTCNTQFVQPDNAHIRFNQTDLESLIHRYYSFGVNMDPDYQRGYVWDQEDKEFLINSIFNHIEIGRFAFVKLDYADVSKTGNGFEIMDGKQRLNALIEFYENRFPYQGYYYNDLSSTDQRCFLNHTVVMGDLEHADRATILGCFLKLNRCGRIMDKSHLTKVEDMLAQLTNSSKD